MRYFLSNSVFQSHFGRFVTIGAVTAAFNALAYSALVLAGAHYLFASGVGWFGGVLLSYFLNRKFTFRSTSSIASSEFARYIFVYVVQLAVSWTGLIILIEVVGYGPFVSYVLNIAIVTMVSFLGVKYFAFRSS